jgi:hypothetical protein
VREARCWCSIAANTIDVRDAALASHDTLHEGSNTLIEAEERCAWLTIVSYLRTEKSVVGIAAWVHKADGAAAAGVEIGSGDGNAPWC